MIINLKKIIKGLNKKSKSKYPGIWYIFKYRPRFKFKFGFKFKNKNKFKFGFKFKNKNKNKFKFGFKFKNKNKFKFNSRFKFKNKNKFNSRFKNKNKFKNIFIKKSEINIKERYSIFKVLTKLYINNILSN